MQRRVSGVGGMYFKLLLVGLRDKCTSFVKEKLWIGLENEELLGVYHFEGARNTALDRFETAFFV